MYAIVQHGGHQYRLEPGQTIEVERVVAAAGDTYTFEHVLFVSGATPRIGAPVVDGATVTATVLGDFKGDKIVVQRYKPKNRYKVRTGHRQNYTRLKVESISG